MYQWQVWQKELFLIGNLIREVKRMQKIEIGRKIIRKELNKNEQQIRVQKLYGM